MKYILTVNWSLLNFDDISKIEYQNYQDVDKYYSYFIMKNGDKYNAHDAPDYFQVDDQQDYNFCSWCHKTFNVLLLKYILRSQDDIINIDEIQDTLWEEFIEMCRDVLPSLEKKIKAKPIFG